MTDSPLTLATTDELATELVRRGFAGVVLLVRDAKHAGAEPEFVYRVRGDPDHLRVLLDHGLHVVNRLAAESGR